MKSECRLEINLTTHPYRYTLHIFQALTSVSQSELMGLCVNLTFSFTQDVPHSHQLPNFPVMLPNEPIQTLAAQRDNFS